MGERDPFDVCVCDKCGPPWREAHPLPKGATWAESLGWNSFMRLCPKCGNKRCPGAADHDNPCSGSNDPGQPGSLYENAPFAPAAPSHADPAPREATDG